jgi:hypothetical protein
LRPTTPVTEADLAKWIADLDSRKYDVREAAMAELGKAEELAQPALRKFLAGKPDLESRRRVERLLGKRGPSPETQRASRALAVLEQTGTAEARQVLEALAKGAPEARLTQEARASLERSRARSSP